MSERKYLNFWQRVGYGSGDLAANMVYGLLTNFVMLYMTTTVGMNAAICGTLIMLSKFADGVSDFFCGFLIDRTKSKMGKARPWMLFSYIGNAVCLIAVFSIPSSWGENVKYVYFFITYTLLNAVFYTANNISYSALVSLITKNHNERVVLGTFRFIFATIGYTICTSFTMSIVYKFSETSTVADANGWRAVAIIFALVGLVVNTISVFSVKELKEEDEVKQTNTKLSLGESLKLLAKNKYFIIVTALYILSYFREAVSVGAAAYFFTYIVGSMDQYGAFMGAYNAMAMVGLIITPFAVRALRSMRKLNIMAFSIQFIFRIILVAAAYSFSGSLTIMIIAWGFGSLFDNVLFATINAFIAEVSEYTLLTTGKKIEGTIFASASIGIKVGSGIGTGVLGWMLAKSGFSETALLQTAACNNMITGLLTVIPLIVTAITVVLYIALKVEDANARLRINEKNS